MADEFRGWFFNQFKLIDEAVDRLSTLVDTCKGEPAAVVARTYIDIKEVDEALDEVAKKLGKIKQLMQYTMVPEAFEREGTSTWTNTDGIRVTISTLTRASMIDKEAGMEWLRTHDLGDIIQPTVNASTLSAVARSMIEEGRELPDDIFNVVLQANTSVTATKKK